MSGLITCRLCKGNKKPTEISGTLSDIEETTEKGPLELRHYISFYCHVDLSSDENLSQAVCKLCRCIFETFVTFSYNLSESEHNYIAAASNPTASIEEVKDENPEITEEMLANGSDDHNAIPLVSESSVTHKYNRRHRPIENVAKVYFKYMKQSLLDLEDFSHVSVGREDLSEDGEISKNWLSQYDIKMWKDFTYSCEKCGKTFKSLTLLLQHIKNVCQTNKILCNFCTKLFSSLGAYINHIAHNKHGLDHLVYTCIECSKIFYNIACLIQHSFTNHLNGHNIYPCIHCGLYLNDLQRMRLHMVTHIGDTDKKEDNSESRSKIRCRKESIYLSKPGRPKKRKRQVLSCST